ncbi:hypothetical protein GCM10009087_35850 [Sphingomonas oligophenolica]|uniref:M50 family peptidase n=1 Tax=Sphingomonas oligophenolica TaxID=301154 RepID=A0ABU9Y9B2_9SPHN
MIASAPDDPSPMIARDDPRTLAAIGVVAACLASIAHETIGHGVTCLAVGGTITRLTATHFRCADGTVLVDALGPAGNLVSAAIAFGLLRTCRGFAQSARLFLLMLGGINLCWFAGEMIHSALINSEDEAHLARLLGWPAAWRPIAVAAGVLIYGTTIRYGAAVARRMVEAGDPPDNLRRRIMIAWAAATASFAVAGLAWARDPFGSAWECFMTIGVAGVPLWIGVGLMRWPDARPTGRRIGTSTPWTLVALLVLGAFVVIQGRGVGPMS